MFIKKNGDETTEVARVNAKTENGTFVKFTYKNIQEYVPIVIGNERC